MKKSVLFGILPIFLISLISANSVQVTFYSDLDNNARVFYLVNSPLEGVGSSKLIAVYDPVENSCRLPNQCELNENRYLPMTCMN